MPKKAGDVGRQVSKHPVAKQTRERLAKAEVEVSRGKVRVRALKAELKGAKDSEGRVDIINPDKKRPGRGQVFFVKPLTKKKKKSS